MANNDAPEQLRELREQLRSLRAEVASLRAEVESARQSSTPSMRQTGRCPHCRGTELLHIQRVYEHTMGDFLKLDAKGWLGRQPVGTFELYACRKCEFAEWYVVGAGEITPAELGRINRDHVRVVSGDPPDGGPFR